MEKLDGSAGTKRARGPLRACLFLLVLAVVGAPACRSSHRDAGAQAKAKSQTPKKVTADDCKLWGTHGAAVFVASVEHASAHCPPAAKAVLKSQFEGQIVSLAGGATGFCMNHVGDQYVEADAACYMKAKDALSLRACHFAPMIPKGDTDWGVTLKRIHDHCSVVPTPGHGAPASGSAAPQPGRHTTSM